MAIPMLTARIELVALHAAIRAARADGRRELASVLECRRVFLAGLIRRAENA